MVSPSSGRISVGEYINNGSVETGSYYQNVSLQNLKWYNLKVDADAVTGELAVYLDDVYLYTYTASTQNRLGRSGVVTGNAGGYFDNFIITSDSIVGPPTDKTQCRKGGWKSFNNPAFKNQGACIRYIRKKSDRLPRFSRFFENFSSKFKVGWRTTR